MSYYELAKLLLGGFILDVLLVVVPLALLVVAYLLVKIWTANPYEIEQVRQLKNTVKLANDGVPNAILACEEDHRVKKGLRFVEGNVKAHYSVPSWVILHAFNIYR